MSVRNCIYKKKALKRVVFSLIIVMVYIFGTNLIFPGQSTRFFMDLIHKSPGLSLALGPTGLSLEHLSVFSIGLGPWMSAQILWRVFTVTKIFNVEVLTTAQSFRIKFIISLTFGVVQSLGIISQVESLTTNNIPTWMLVMFLVTGLSIIIWLGNINAQYGVGGSTIIIITNMLMGLPRSIASTIKLIGGNSLGIFKIIIFLFFMILILLVIFNFYQGERRVKLTHVMLDDNYASQSYFPISTNPAGGMPFMYSFSVMLFPQYIFFLVEKLSTKNGGYKPLPMNHFSQIIVLLFTIVLFTYGFSYINVDYKVISKNMRANGDYFANVYPGKNTEKFLFRKVTAMATISALSNCLIIGIPLILSIFWKNGDNVIYLVPTLIIVMILMQQVCNQFYQSYYRDDYKPFLTGELIYKN